MGNNNDQNQNRNNNKQNPQQQPKTGYNPGTPNQQPGGQRPFNKDSHNK